MSVKLWETIYVIAYTTELVQIFSALKFLGKSAFVMHG